MLRTGDRSSRERRVAARLASRRDVRRRRSRAHIHTHTHTRTHSFTLTHAPTPAGARAHARAPRRNQPLVDRPVAPTCRVGGSPRFFFAVGVRPDRPSRWRRRRRRRYARVRRRASASLRDRARERTLENVAKIGRRARARVCQTHAMSNATRRVRAAESKVKPASLPKLGGPARIGGSCEAARRDSPRENSAGNQMGSTVARGRRAARRFAYRQLHVHTTTVAPRRGATRCGAVVVAMPHCVAWRSVRGKGGKNWLALSFSVHLAVSSSSRKGVMCDFQHWRKRVHAEFAILEDFSHSFVEYRVDIFTFSFIKWRKKM